ncbi:acyl-CoA dehydrogenase family protein [Actinomadura sp. 7K534]|uniref:acyl-CoA dehydrogenase family protein n=1 Tax=Actinomadura sp. 7K534 TaxID=2530366 RepID=UPI001404D74F|nr:acyl-CoA dehydrogenase family protein [Actinomadura sp. 7K534]
MRLMEDTRESALREEFRAFFAEHCAPEYADECDARGRFPEELYRAAGQAGLLGACLPAEHGGRGEDATALAILFSEAGRAFPDFANLIVRQHLCATVLERFGSPEQRAELLPRFARGGIHMAFGASERGAGSDVTALATTARRDGGEYVVDGEKLYATGAHVADAVLVFAREPGTSGREGICALVVWSGNPGMRAERLDTLGVRATGTAMVTLTAARVPADARVGGDGEGWRVLRSGLDMERLATAAIATGASRFLLDRTIGYLNERRQFGRPLSGLQAVRHRLADLAMRTDAAELATMAVAHGLATGAPVHLDASVAKLAATETYMAVAHQAVQLEGGHGYTKDSVVQRHYRDAKMYEIGGGASDVQRDIIARGLGL